MPAHLLRQGGDLRCFYLIIKCARALMMFGLEYSIHVYVFPVRQCRVAPREDVDSSAARILQLECRVVVAPS